MLRRLLRAFALCFLLPLAASAIWWTAQDRPDSWRAADWSASGVLPAAADVPGAAIHVMAARTGGMKGAASVHSWLVWKRADTRWTRAEVVGWGRPVRIDAYAPDARWYSNAPYIVGTVTGADASTLIGRIEAAIDTYPWNDTGTYRIWPGPNSNTFVAHVLREVPKIGVTLPPHAVGKDWLGHGPRALRDAGGDLHLSAWGYAGLSLGPRSGIEVNLMGQAFGLDFARPALKLPGIGRVGS
ncbi:DUF3750 domain-containing protein [Jannaschia sp. S6380]|uniref:DUF3750 domain-containing protein n=1 Tax=Jannaschia sp. S6380 TaxID=2926408 RepID=UPI001FF35DCC|nr:DUF3750 domain-containing protein [Jannaschia sp. S6380]MCK0167897.1 DUF3750 domain-containing protein [Jannaschia sp. S6380]